MNAKPLDRQGHARPVLATAIERSQDFPEYFPENESNAKLISSKAASPADYPLGSPQSRALARAWAEAMDPRSIADVQRDEDALQLYRLMFELYGQTYPDYSTIRNLPIIQRANEVRLKKYGPIVPLHECPDWSRSTSASREFERCFYREPKAGDLLRWEYVRVIRGPELYETEIRPQIEAWNRQIPSLDCPLKFENGRLFKRNRRGEWFEEVSASWQYHWMQVQMDAGVNAPVCLVEPLTYPSGDVGHLVTTTILGVTFLGVIDGKHACRPSTNEELGRAENDEFFRWLFCQQPEMAPPQGYVWIHHKGSGYYEGVPVAIAALLTEGPCPEYTCFDLRPDVQSEGMDETK